jgi:GH24 family phage-related lysozyme (muramidase)
VASNCARKFRPWQRGREYAENQAGTVLTRSMWALLKWTALVIAIFCLGKATPMAAQGCTPPPANCPCNQPPSSPISGTNYSNIDKGVIAKHEGGDLPTAYTLSPTRWPNAGVTVGIGVDLGQQTAAGLSGMGVPQSLIDKLTPYMGLTGTSAQSYLNAHPLTLTSTEDSQLNNAVLSGYFNQLGANFNDAAPNFNLSDLPWQAQTVLADLSYNLGNLATAAPNLWDQMTNGDWSAAYNNLMNFTNKDDVLKARAQADAALLKQAMDNCTLP